MVLQITINCGFVVNMILMHWDSYSVFTYETNKNDEV